MIAENRGEAEGHFFHRLAVFSPSITLYFDMHLFIIPWKGN
jgi:hypothetical protein